MVHKNLFLILFILIHIEKNPYFVDTMWTGEELANYGEYSGDPNEDMTYEYAKTIISLMTSGEALDGGKVLIIGGGIANFTNVAQTFKGIIRAITDFS